MQKANPQRVMIIAFLVIFPLAAWCAGPALPSVDEGQGWPQWRGPNGNGISAETGWNPAALAGGPKVVWVANVGTGVSGLALRDGRLFTMSKNFNNETVLALDADTGEELWRYTYDSGGISAYDAQSTPAVDENQVYTLGTEGDVSCLGAADGTVLWQKNIVRDYQALKEQYHFATSPVVEAEQVLLNVNASGMALDKRTGSLVWTSGIGRPLSNGKYATPVLSESNGARSALLLSNHVLVSIEPASGRILWSYDLPAVSANIVDPVLCESRVFLPVESDHQGRLIAVSSQPASTLWQTTKLRSTISTPVYLGGYLYGNDGQISATSMSPQATLRCIDVATGTVQWEKAMQTAFLIAAAGKLIVLEQNGTLHIVEATPSAYTEISSCKLPKSGPVFWTPPVLYRGRIYCRNVVGDVVCIDVRQ